MNQPIRSFLGALALCSLGACAEESVDIAVIPKGTSHRFWKSMHAGAREASDTTGRSITWKGPAREDDRQEQIKVVENFIASGVKGIVLAPLDDRALVPVLKEADAAGIPVVIVDSDVQWDGRVSFVASDNKKGGSAAAKELGSLLGGEGDVILLRYQEGSASTTNRETGFLETMASDFPNINVVSSNQYAGATSESAFQKAENLLLSHPDIDGVFCPNESAVVGMLRALEESGKAGQVKFVGFDATPQLVEALSAGTIDGLVLQDPFAMGQLGVKVLVDHLKGQAVAKRIDTGVHVAKKSNMDDELIARLLGQGDG